MAIDVTNLSQTDLLQIANATPLGTVLDRSRLRRQMDKAAFRVGDGKHIHLVRYVAWLARELDKPQPKPVDYVEARKRQAEKNRAGTKAAQDIFPIPEVEDYDRRLATSESFRLFCETYFPRAFYRAWSPDHLKVIAKIERAVKEGGLFAFAMPRGSGKALALDTPLPTPDGWTTMGDVRVGDMLFDQNGRQCRVVFATEVMYDRPCYRVSFSDRESLVCDADHLWTVRDRYVRRNPVTLRTADMAGRTRLGSRPGRAEHRYAIPLARPLQTLGDPLPIPPYVLGLWLGNGNARCSEVTNHADDQQEFQHLVLCAGEVLDAKPQKDRGLARTGVLSRRGTMATIQAPLQSRLRQLDLIANKHIPPRYLRAGVSDRLALLQGLMDTDGSVSDGGGCELTLKDGALARDAADLLASLGIKFGVGEKWVWLNGRRMGPYRRFAFTSSMELPVFRLRRKQAKLPLQSVSSATRRRFITAIRAVPSVPVRCIQVDSPSQLYLAGRKMVPTHNTTLARLSALWAVLVGYRPFVCLIGGSDERAKDLLLPIKKYVLENPGLLADFPEAVYPLRCLENSSKRQLQQHIQGRLTHLHWGQDKLVFPTIESDHLPQALREAGVEDSPSSGSIITITSLDANMRGQQHTRTDGSTIRPSLVLLDDPQTRQSARSPTQTKYRLQLLNGDVLGLAGPGEEIAGVLTCTKIYEDDLADQLLNRDTCPEWQAECTKLVYAFPSDEKLWQQYAQIRAESLRQGNAGEEATAFYRQHRVEMDAGAVVAWPERFEHKKELSALQHAMNLKLRDEEAFFAEYQNEPMQEQLHDEMLSVEQVMEKANGRSRGEVPLAATKLTMFVDVHEKLLYWCICAWEENFTGYVVDYGTFPEQSHGYFTMVDARKTLGRTFPGMGTDGAIRTGLEKLVAASLARDFKRGAGLVKIDRLLVDMGFKPGLVADVKHKAGGAVMMLAKGVGIRAGRKPMSTYARKPGEVHGHFWYSPSVSKTAEFPHVAADVNYWKTFVHSGLATAAGDPGAITIFGRKPRDHELFAEHVAHSETWVETQGHGRVVHEWSLRPAKPDNHWLDCLVGCAAAASMLGVRAAGMDEKPTRPRKRYTQDDLRRR